MSKKPYTPKGCDQQGRYLEAAEAATDLGVDEPPEPSIYRVVLVDCLIAAVIVATVAAIVLGVAG